MSTSAPTSARHRWVGVGQSSVADARAAGAAAVGAALTGPDPKLLLVFCSEAYDVRELLAAIAERAPGTPLLGCSTAGEIGPAGATTSSVVVTAFGGDGFSARTAAAPGASRRLREAGAEVATALPADDESRPFRVTILLTDALGGDQQEVIRGAYGVLGAVVPLVGGCAGDDFNFAATSQFFDGEVYSDTLVAAALASDAPIGIGVHHGWRPVGEPVLVTKSEGNRVFTLDDRPALEVYLERLDAPAATYTDPRAFAQFGLTHPLGLGRRSTEDGARFVADASFEDGSLGMIAAVPQGGVAWFLEGNAASVLDATDQACSDAVAALAGRPPLALVAFDCAARRLVLGDDGIRDEVELIAGHGGGAPISGFYSYGEIARTRGASGIHNQTLVVLAVS